MLTFKIIPWDSFLSNSDEHLFLKEDCPAIGEHDKNLIIITDTAHQISMGAMALEKRELNEIQGSLRSLIPVGAEQTHVWECSMMESPQRQQDHEFYRSLYNALVAFGRQNKAGFITVKLTLTDYLRTKDMGLWPYVVQLLEDDLFYGVLPLRGSLVREYQQMWDQIEKGCAV